MELIVQDPVIRQDHVEKLRENASTILEEQLIVWRGWRNHDVAPFFRFCAKVAVENVVHRVHCLRTSPEGEDSWISLRWIVSVGKNDLIPDCGSAHLLSLL